MNAHGRAGGRPSGETAPDDLPDDLAGPARRALANAGCTRLDQVARLSEGEVRRLHGMGPKALGQLRAALADRGLSFADGGRGDPV